MKVCEMQPERIRATTLPDILDQKPANFLHDAAQQSHAGSVVNE